MWKKIAKHTAILAGFCLALVLMIQLGNWLVKSRSASASSDRIRDSRLVADELYQSFERSRYFQPQRTIALYDIVLEDDPDNGGALYRRAITYRRWYRATAIQDENNQEELKKIFDKAIEDFQRLLDFPEYRNRARHSMSMLHAHQGNFEESITMLRTAIENGYVSDGNNFYSNHLTPFFYKKMKQDQQWDRQLRRLMNMELKNFRRRNGG